MSRPSALRRLATAIFALVISVSTVSAVPFPVDPCSRYNPALPIISPRACDPTASTVNDLLLDWEATTTTSSVLMITAAQDDPLLFSPDSTTATSTILAAPTSTSWAAPPTFSDMSAFSVSLYAAGASNLAVLRGSPAVTTPTTLASNSTSVTSFPDVWDDSINSLQIRYPRGSINPGNCPQGGTEFYANPLDISRATNASLEYTVYFPSDFEFVKGGKLPGLYGGHKGCSGGNAAVDCFSTRMMWRTGGKGELYLYAPNDKQMPSLCSTPPQSVCDAQYGLSIGRGSWTFAPGAWTTIRQDIWLNTPGQNDGGFNIWINGQLVITANNVLYRENADTCLNPLNANVQFPLQASANNDNSTIEDEDWQPSPSTAPTTTTMGPLSNATSSQTIPTSNESNAALPIDKRHPPRSFTTGAPIILSAPSVKVITAASPKAEDCSIGFIGLFFSTFFGGHTSDWASPTEQYTYFRDFGMWINN